MYRITRPGWAGNLIALLAGALTPLAAAPFDIWPLQLLSIALFYLLLRELTGKQAFWRGWWFGFGLFAAGTSWVYVSINTYGGAPMLLAGMLTLLFVMGLGLFFALPAFAWAKWLRCNRSPLLDALAFAALWLAQEAFRGWFLTGFPWLYAGYTQLEGPLSGLAPLGGVWLISFSLALTAALLVNSPALLRNNVQLIPALILLVAPWITGMALKSFSWTTPIGEPLSVAAIQGNIDQDMKWQPGQIRAQLELYRDKTFNSPPVDLMIWPETAIPVFQDEAQPYLEMMGQFARERQMALITGLPVRQSNGTHWRYYNAITSIGEGKGLYFKQKLVPFGEYVPLQDLLRGLIAFFNLPMSDFARGPAHQALLSAGGYRIAPYICYEVVYPEFTASLAAKSDLLLTISNDAWFGTSIGPLQHMQMVQMRALEAGRWMIRGTNNGITALVDPFGRVTTSIPQFEQGVMYGEVHAMSGLTPYLQWRSWPLAAVATLTLLGALVQRRRSP